ncbi:hypothetical protein [Micromonospora cathayae]|uniref:Ig-like domain-containing protein n=1 Tax=Micromonospora cathayae TaxID=3028804 RepID=A0ABY7ZM43_9ACTN|nr:hypothetical protein [Micromonospora sp. HUAS 3]WDZ83583.1 hypothetical protein PVK37_24430 [Micromonospora sp. HUAS 3]
MRSSNLSRLVVAALTATVAVTGCSVTVDPSGRSKASGADPATDTAGSTGDGPGSAPTDGGGSKDDGGATGGGSSSGSTGGSTGGGSTGGGNPTTKPATSTTTKAAANGPQIVQFRVRQQPSCPAGTNVNPIAGNPVVLEWEATNVDRVALSVDGPGIYGDSYAPTGTETLNFPCSGPEGSTQKHTYQLTVTNAHGKQTRTLTVSARVNGVAPV